MNKRIIFVLDSIDNSGIFNAVIALISELLKLDKYEITIICHSVKNDTFKDERLKIINFDLNKYGKIKYLFLMHKIKEILNISDYDSIIVSGMQFVPFYYYALKNINIKKIAWEHRNFFAGPLFRLEWFGKRIACKYFDKVVVLTKKDEEYYKEYCRETNKIINIYNIVSNNNSLRKYNTESRKIMSVGYLDINIKGYDLLIKVAKKVLTNNPGWEWDIYGEGLDKNKLCELIKINNLDNKVNLLGYCEDVKSKYNDYGIFVFTSRSEGMGMVLVEALFNKLPIISFDIDCGPSDIIASDIGYLIRKYDVDEMADKIETLINNAKKRINMSNNTVKYFDKFNKNYSIEKWVNILG